MGCWEIFIFFFFPVAELYNITPVSCMAREARKFASSRDQQHPRDEQELTDALKDQLSRES